MSDRDLKVLLNDIKEAIQNIFEFTKSFSFEQYASDIKTRHAVEHNFMIIGEAVARLPETFKLQHKIVNWREVKDFRNIIVHEYFGIDNNIVWDIIQLSLSDLLQDITFIIQQEK